MTSNDDILRALGRVEGRLTGIEENVALLRNEVRDEKANAHDSRAVIHTRLDEQARQIAHLDTRAALSGGVDAQIREEIKSLKETVEKNQETVAPALEEWKRMKSIGYGISGLIAFAGLTVGGMIAYASDGAVAALRHWLKIS
ncbi:MULTISPECIES: DUF1515 domain-containing protein [Rhizobium]|uniref:DUF1515 domain-containing protein n=1 Tax=Rhizobium TaxID=379 RepID=UPI000BE93756|nr:MULTISPECIES: DUF1515 domain-containing protein [Rhizobium]MBY4591664.1 DUF1515 domain-containing protein [Rhizobium redzepovicii]MBY4613257.1 DUF1515 domain-containing protein [Rhizobium redzepovicii]MDF0657905.1 DUF1515 domain-containing protein [Rhizobium sp. BC49]PDS83867.1 DUF1515 domain-containing protein [Rhizobium sp. L18]TBY42221.1 DUF1515 domain-containing protein [Rhizobium leguminosarum bv. viciae]